MPSASERVTRFIAMWDAPDGFPRAVDEFFRPDTVWENVGLVTTTGPAEALGFYASFGGETGMATIRVENLAVAEVGNKVLTERIDHIVGGDGAVRMSIRVMGIFELDEAGRITAWRDYFDTAGMQAGG